MAGAWMQQHDMSWTTCVLSVLLMSVLVSIYYFSPTGGFVSSLYNNDNNNNVYEHYSFFCDISAWAKAIYGN